MCVLLCSFLSNSIFPHCTETLLCSSDIIQGIWGHLRSCKTLGLTLYGLNIPSSWKLITRRWHMKKKNRSQSMWSKILEPGAEASPQRWGSWACFGLLHNFLFLDLSVIRWTAEGCPASTHARRKSNVVDKPPARLEASRIGLKGHHFRWYLCGLQRLAQQIWQW